MSRAISMPNRVRGAAAKATRLLAASALAAGVSACGGEEGGGEAGTGGATPVWGDPIDVAPDEQWTWVPIAGTVCADGTEAGVGVNFTAQSRELVIFFRATASVTT